MMKKATGNRQQARGEIQNAKCKMQSAKWFSGLVVFILVVFAHSFVHAALTKQLSYQGRLNDASGQPVPNGTYSITFSIYNVASGGVPLWTETQNVNVDKGGFSAYLGSVTPLNLLFNEDYFLGIKVGSDPEMTPRLKLSVVGASAFSLEAEKLQGKAASDFALATHTHTGLTATNSDTVDSFHASATPTANTLLALDVSAKFPASVIDTTSATNMVTQILAGTGVSITPVGGTGVVTINASGGGGTPATTVTTVGPNNVVGISGNFAREDHMHRIPMGLITDAEISATAGIATSKLSGTVSAISGNGLGALATMNAVGSPQIADNSIALVDIAQNGCTSGQIMKWNGSAWACDVDLTGGGGGIIPNPTSTQTIIAGNATTSPLVLQAAATPSVSMFEVKDSGGQLKLGVMPDGHVFIPATNTLHVLNINNDSPTGPMGNMTIDVMNNAANSKLILQNSDTSFTAGLDVEGQVLVGNPVTTTAQVSAYETGLLNHGGFFQIANASSSRNAVEGATSGTGPAIYGYTTGTGYAGKFWINNVSSPESVILGNTTGTGNLLQLQQGAVNKFVVDNAGNITVGGAANTVKNNPSANQTIIAGNATTVPLALKGAASPSVPFFDIQDSTATSLINVNPSGNLLVGNPSTTLAKVSAYETGTANNAGYFKINNAGNANPAVQVLSNGTNSAIYVTTSGTGGAGTFEINNATNSSRAVFGTTGGTGIAGDFQITNASNTSSAVNGYTNGTGPIFAGNTTGAGNLLQLQQGAVDKFVVDNAGNITVGGAANAVKNNPTATQTILAGNATTTPLIVKSAPTPSVPLFDVQNDTGLSQVKVGTTGNLLVGDPTTTTAKVSAYETGTTNNGGWFEISNVSNNQNGLVVTTNGTGTGIFAQNTGTGANAHALRAVILNGSATAPAFSIRQDGSGDLIIAKTNTDTVTKFQVTNAGNLLVGNPAYTTAKVSVEETGTGNFAGYFKISNAANTNDAVYGQSAGSGAGVFGYAAGTGKAVYGYVASTGGYAGYFDTQNVSNTVPVIYGNTTSAQASAYLIQLQQNYGNKFVVDNTGNILLDGNANPSIKASGATPNLIIDADGTGASMVIVKNTTSPGNVMLQVNGNITAFSGSNSVPVTGGAQQLIQTGNACEALVTSGVVSVTFTPAFGATPTVTFGQTGGTAPSPAPSITAKNASSFTVSGFETSATSECIDWIAIGNK